MTSTETAVSTDVLRQTRSEHARSCELRTAVLAMLDGIELCADTFLTAYYWAAYAKAYGMNTEQAAFFGVVQATV